MTLIPHFIVPKLDINEEVSVLIQYVLVVIIQELYLRRRVKEH